MFARLLLGGILGMVLATFSSSANAVNGTGPLVSGADRNGGLLARCCLDCYRGYANARESLNGDAPKSMWSNIVFPTPARFMIGCLASY
jgi:hypothetical protein